MYLIEQICITLDYALQIQADVLEYALVEAAGGALMVLTASKSILVLMTPTKLPV
jgi:hypothetical protein